MHDDLFNGRGREGEVGGNNDGFVLAEPLAITIIIVIVITIISAGKARRVAWGTVSCSISRHPHPWQWFLFKDGICLPHVDSVSVARTLLNSDSAIAVVFNCRERSSLHSLWFP